MNEFAVKKEISMFAINGLVHSPALQLQVNMIRVTSVLRSKRLDCRIFFD